MSATRRSFLRGLASAAGVASASTAYAQHVHPVTTPAAPGRPPAAVPPGKFGAGVVPVLTPDVPDMPWRLEDGLKVFDIEVGPVLAHV